MKLEVGMYVRGKYYQYRGKIGKIIKNYNNDLEIAYQDGILKTNVGSFIDDNYDINGKQYKASFNITDILEVGDIVIIEDFVDEACMIFKDMYYLQNEQQLFNLKNDLARNKNKKISRILTKEQFEQMSYKI